MFDQSPYACRLEWGRRGAREASERGFEADVKHCSQLDVFQCVPRLHEDHFKDAFSG